MKDITYPQLFPVDRKSPQCFRKKDILKTNKSVKDFNWWDPPASPAPTYGGQETKNSLTDPSHGTPAAAAEGV